MFLGTLGYLLFFFYFYGAQINSKRPFESLKTKRQGASLSAWMYLLAYLSPLECIHRQKFEK